MLGAIGLGLVKGFTRNIKEEKLRRIADQEKVDLYEQMMIKASLENENMTPAAIAYMGNAIKNARGKLGERESIDMFGTQSKALDMDFTQDLPMIRALMKQPKEEEKEFQVPYPVYFQATERDENGELYKDGYFAIPAKQDTMTAGDAAGVLNWVTDGALQTESAQQMFKKYPSLAQQVKDYISYAVGIVSYNTEQNSIKEGYELGSELGPGITDALKIVNNFVVPFTQVSGVGTSVAGASVVESQRRGEKVDTGISIGDGVVQKFALDETAKANMEMAAASFGVPLAEFGHYIQDTLYNNEMNVFANNGTVHTQLFGGTMSFVAEASKIGNPTAILDPTSPAVLQDENAYLKLSDALDKVVKSVGNPGELEFAKAVNILAPLMQVTSGDKKLGGRFVTTTKKDTRTVADYVLTLIPGGTKGKTDAEINKQYAAVAQTIEGVSDMIAARAKFDSVTVRKLAKAFNWAREAVFDISATVFADKFASDGEAGNWYGGEIDPNRTLRAGEEYVTGSFIDKKITAAISMAGDDTDKAKAFAEFEALRISLAFQLARAADPSGRLSNQDIEQQMVQLGDFTDTQTTAIYKLNKIKERLMKEKPKLQALSRLLGSNDTVNLATMAAAEATLAKINLDLRVGRVRQGSRGGNAEADYRLVPHTTLDAFVKEDKNNVILSENDRTVYFDKDGNRMTERPKFRPQSSAAPTPAPAPAGQSQAQSQSNNATNPPAPPSGLGYDDSEVTVTQGKGNKVTGFELTLKGQNQPLPGRFLWDRPSGKWIAK